MSQYRWYRKENLKTIPELLYRAEHLAGHKTALTYFNRNIRYSELLDTSRRVGNFIKAATEPIGEDGLPERVALLMPNLPQFVFAYYGTILADRITVPINFSTVGAKLKQGAKDIQVTDEIVAQFRDSRPALVFVADMLYSIFKQVPIDWPCKVVVCKVSDYLPFPLNKLYDLKNWKEGKSLNIPDEEFWFKYAADFPRLESRWQQDMDAVAELQYTGGTNGTPKGAILTHRNLVSNAWQAREQIGDLVKDGKAVMLAALPLFHIYGLTCMNITLLALRGKLVLVPAFKPKEVVDLIAKHQVDMFPGVNLMYQAIMSSKNATREKLWSLKLCFYGAGPLDPKVGKWFSDELGVSIMGGYGLSETSPVLSVTLPGDTPDPRAKGALIGSPVPGTTISVVDEDRNELPEGEIGEFVASGPQIAQGYWNRPEETAEVFVGGRFYTGDLGQYIGGQLYFVDRNKDMSKINGENIYHKFIEEVITFHPAVFEVAVVSVPDERSGDAAVAVVVLKEGNVDTPELRADIRKFAADKLSRNYVPQYIQAFASLDPYKTPIGKVLKRKVKEDVLKQF